MKRILIKALTMTILSIVLLLVLAIPAFADTTGNQGQPSQSCQAQTASPPGFNTAGFANATSHYAGSQPQNSGNPNSVAQYDVACYQLSQPHP